MPIYPRYTTSTAKIDDDALIVIHGVVQSRPYSFVWLDCCHSGGGAPNDPLGWTIGAPDNSWAFLFNIDTADPFTGDTGAFWGWDGNAGANVAVLGGGGKRLAYVEAEILV